MGALWRRKSPEYLIRLPSIRRARFHPSSRGGAMKAGPASVLSNCGPVEGLVQNVTMGEAYH